MNTPRAAKYWVAFSIIVAVPVCRVDAQSGQRAPVPSLQQFFQRLVNDYDPSSLPKYEDVLKVVDQISHARPEDITKALPAILTALAHPDDNLKRDAALAFFAISQRPDSAALLKDQIKRISLMFDLSDPQLQGVPTVIFLNLKPVPPPEVLPYLLTFLKRTDRDPRAQGSAVFALIRIAPDKPEVVAAIEEFLSRPLDSSSRIGALNALGIPSVKDVHLIAIVIASLDDSDYGVRYTAVQVLRRIGQHAVLQGQSRLQELAGDPAQPADIRAAAREALRTIRPG